MDNLTKQQRSHVMSSIRGMNTSPELRIRKLMKALHFSYLPNGVYGNPDFADKKNRTAVFVDGCFWHGCPRHYKPPTSNARFWKMKLERNKKHDQLVTSALMSRGWKVVRIWEHDISV